MRPGVLGEILWFGGMFAPVNWMVCEGQRLHGTEFEGLFNAIAPQFRSADQTLTLPALAGLSGARPIICVQGALANDDRSFPIDGLMGDIRLFAFPGIPRGWEACDGHSIDLYQNVALHSILDYRFGGEGRRYQMPNLAAPAAGLRYAIANYGIYPDYGSDRNTQNSQTIGELRLWPGTRVPAGWWPCDGRLVHIHTNTAMFSVLGDTFGGDRRTTFGLPTLAGPIAGTQFIICHSGIFPSRG